MNLKKSLLQIIVVSVGIFLFSYYFLSLFFHNLNGDFLYYFKNLKLDTINKDLIVVEIDDLTYNKLWFPLDRSYYLQFLENLKTEKPAVIAFDILFLDKWKDSETDIKLANKFSELWNIVIWMDIKDDKQVVFPYDLFKKSVKNIWYFQPFVNPNTKKVYSIEPFRTLNSLWKNAYFESFSFVILRENYNFLFWQNDNKIGDTSNWEYNFLWKKIPFSLSEILWNRDVMETFIN